MPRTGPGAETKQRLAVIRALLSKCWDHTRIKDELSRQWDCSRTLIERLMERVLQEAKADLEKNREVFLAEMVMQMREHYAECMKDKQYGAAGRYFDRMIQLTGLDVKHVEITGHAGGPVQVLARPEIQLDKLTDEQLEVLGKVFEKLETAEPAPPLLDVPDPIEH